MKKIMILGANSDIAKAIARVYAKNGYGCYFAAKINRAQDIKKIIKDIEFEVEGFFGEFIEFDVSNISNHYDFSLKFFNKIDGVVCAVGALEEQIPENILNLTMINYVGCASILSYFANGFKLKKHGFIVGISSVAGDRGRAINYYYGAAKSAFSTFLSGLRQELSSFNVSVLTVKPGFVKTNMTKNMRFPGSLISDPKNVAKDVFIAQQNEKDIIYVQKRWKAIMFLVKLIPEMFFKKMRF